MATKSIKQSPRWLRSWTTRRIGLGTRVVLLRGTGEGLPGVVTEVRIVPHLKRFVIQADDGATRYASENDLALEGDPLRVPLGPSMHLE